MSEQGSEPAKVRSTRGVFAAENPSTTPARSLADHVTDIYAAIQAAPDGIPLTQAQSMLPELLSRKATDATLAKIRAQPWVISTTERRPNRAGRLQPQVILRAATAPDPA